MSHRKTECNIQIDQSTYDHLLNLAIEGKKRHDGLIGSLVNEAVDEAFDHNSPDNVLKIMQTGFRFCSNTAVSTPGDVEVRYEAPSPSQAVTVVGRISGDSLVSLRTDGVQQFVVTQGAVPVEQLVQQEQESDASGRLWMRVFAVCLLLLGILAFVKKERT